MAGYTTAMNHIFISHSPEETANFGAEISQNLIPGLVTLEGQLGAGKTKFASGLLEALGAEGPYQSPTFMLMKEYHLPQATSTGIERIYHADAYRLEAKDFQNLGLQEWLEDVKALTILEWPEKVEELLPSKRTAIIFEIQNETGREIQVRES